jgi:hypothetical protein
MSSEATDDLMLSGVVAYCPDCAVDTIFVAPEPDGRNGEHACTACGAAVFIELSVPADAIAVPRVA